MTLRIRIDDVYLLIEGAIYNGFDSFSHEI